MEKTLGGDRLGSGKKMKVELHNFERSTFDLGYLWRSTMAAGTLVPFMCEIALPGDTFDINLDCDIKTHPTIGPLFGSYKVQLDTFQVPIRLYNSALHNNGLGIGRNMSQVKLPQLRLTADEVQGALKDVDNSQINPSSILSYLGIRGVGNRGGADQPPTRDFNAVPYLAYWEIYKNYYANKQEEIGAVLHTPSISVTGTIDALHVGTRQVAIPREPQMANEACEAGEPMKISWTGAPPNPEDILINSYENGWRPATFYSTNWVVDSNNGKLLGTYNRGSSSRFINWDIRAQNDMNTGKPGIATFELSNIDKMRMDILGTDGTTPFVITGTDMPPYKWPLAKENNISNCLSSQEGLALKTYQSDLFNNWLKTENIEQITSSTAVDVSGGSFTIDQLNLSKKVYNMLNRINVSGGSYDDWIDAVYTHDRYQRAESPMYMGGLIKELVFQEVVSNAESTDQPLGTLAGKGILSKKHKGGSVVIRVDEPSYIMGIISLTPRLDYSQGNKWDVNLKTMDDFYKPSLGEIGFQELITEQMAWWDTIYNGTSHEWIQRSAGKQPAWLNYMTNVNQTRGNFAIAENEMFMTLNRRYEWDDDLAKLGDLTTYIDPSKFNFIFAETALDAQNFWAQIAVDITARRKMSSKIMPNL